MDNEREIGEGAEETTDLIERSKVVFLREIINEFKRKQQQYDLPTEFAKTRRNRSRIVPLTIIALVAVMGGGLYGVTRYIQANSRSITINIDDFADVNLRDVLDEANRLQTQLDGVLRDIADLEGQLADAIQQAERARDREISLLADAQLTQEQLRQREEAAIVTADSAIAAVRSELEPRIAELEAEAERLREELLAYDARQLEAAREQEEILNNQQAVFDLEMEQLRTEYETRIERLTVSYEAQIVELETYQADFERTIRARHANEMAALRQAHANELAALRQAHADEIARLNAEHAAAIAALRLRFNPVLDDEPVGRLLGVSQTTQARQYRGTARFDALLEQEGVVSRAEYDALAEQYAALQEIIGRLAEIPAENSIPAAIEQLAYRSRDLAATYDSMWQGLATRVEERDAVIAAREATIADQETRLGELGFALNELSRINGDTGYVLDARDPETIVVFVNSVRNVAPGALGYVFRRDDEYVGSIRFREQDGRVVASVVGLVDDMTIQSFDKVLVEAQ